MSEITSMAQPDLLIKCNCTGKCGVQLGVNNLGDKKNKMLEFNVRKDGRRKWMGVVIDGEELKKLKQFMRIGLVSNL